MNISKDLSDGLKKKLISSMSNDNRNLSSLIFEEKLIFLSRAVACVE